MRIAVDAMGSDKNPIPDVAGAILAAHEYQEEIVLVGDKTSIQKEIAKHDTQDVLIEIIHASQAVTMADKPGLVGRAKPDSSMHVGMRLVKEGHADAFVTVGNTGAALAIATLHTIKRIPGIHRPALTAIMTIQGNSVIALDVGANADCKAEWLVQFACMGSIYAEHALQRQKPRVGLLSNGEEAGKGTALIQEVAELLTTESVNFTGNIEPKELLNGGVDVVVMDGFSGNILIKSMEAFGSTLFDLMRREMTRDVRSKLGGLLARSAFKRVYKQVDPFEIGGVPLLGVNGIVIIGHGRSNANAVKNAIRQARTAVQGQIIDKIHHEFAGTA